MISKSAYQIRDLNDRNDFERHDPFILDAILLPQSRFALEIHQGDPIIGGVWRYAGHNTSALLHRDSEHWESVDGLVACHWRVEGDSKKITTLDPVQRACESLRKHHQCVNLWDQGHDPWSCTKCVWAQAGASMVLSFEHVIVPNCSASIHPLPSTIMNAHSSSAQSPKLTINSLYHNHCASYHVRLRPPRLTIQHNQSCLINIDNPMGWVNLALADDWDPVRDCALYFWTQTEGNTEGENKLAG